MNIKSFKFDTDDIRVVWRDDDPWFAAKDVCGVLGIGNMTESTRNLDHDERYSVLLSTPGGPQETTIISEPGLYALVGRSRKPIARKFDRWVRHEVLPALRKTGHYSTDGIMSNQEVYDMIAKGYDAMVNNLVELKSCQATTNRDVTLVKQDIMRVETKVDSVSNKVSLLEAGRRRVSKKTRETHQLMKHCGICQTSLTKNQGKWEAEIDHFYQKSRNQLSETWALCKPCHTAKADLSKSELDSLFGAYHFRLKKLINTSNPQKELLLFEQAPGKPGSL